MPNAGSPPAPPPTARAVLFVFPYCLDRAGHGNIQRLLSMAGFLARQGFAVDLVYQGNPHVASREHELTACRRVFRVDAWHGSDDERWADEWHTFYEGVPPPPANLTPGGALTALVRALLDAMDYTAVIATYAWTAPVFEPVRRGPLRIVDLQDVLYLHGMRSQQATGSPSNFSMSERTERHLWGKWDILLGITEDESRIVRNAIGHVSPVLTVGHAAPLAPPRAGHPYQVVYTGSDNPSNRHAVAWLLSDVWPRVVRAEPRAQLRLVGLVCDTVRDTPLADTPNLELAGFVERTDDELAAAGTVVAPYLYGSGLKIKVIEAAAAGRAIVTTTAGADGSGLVAGTHALVEDDAARFAAAVVSVLRDAELRTRLGAAARSFAEQRYSEEACYGELAAVLRSQPLMRAVDAGVPPAARARLRTAVEGLGGPRLVVWGNGSHTRLLAPVLEALGLVVRCIVDGGAAAPASVGAGGIPVVPASEFVLEPDDLIVLSSQTFERDMWERTAPLRARGAQVLGLYDYELVTRRIWHTVGHRWGRTLETLPHAAEVMPPSAKWDGARPKRLLIASPTFARGGSEEYLIALADRSLKDGWTPVVWLPDVAGLDSVRKDLAALGASCEPLPLPPQDTFSDPEFLRTRAALVGRLRLSQPDRAIVVLPTIGCGAPLIDALAIERVPAAIVHQLVHRRHAFSEFERQVHSWARDRRQAWVAVSAQNRDLLCASLGWDERAVQVVPNTLLRQPVSLTPAAAGAVRGRVRRALRVPDDATMVLTVARLHRQKGLDVLIDAAERLAVRHPGLHVVVAGDGELAGELRERVAGGSAAGCTHLLGHRTDVQELLQAADIFALPSRFEGLPFALLEALSAGLPVVCSDIGPHREVLTPGEHALFVPVDDASELAAALERLAGDRVLRQALSEAARARARSFLPDAHFGPLFAAIDRVSTGDLVPAAAGSTPRPSPPAARRGRRSTGLAGSRSGAPSTAVLSQ